MDDWWAQLDELIADARAQVGDDAVRARLEDALEGFDRLSADDAPLTPLVAVLGVVPCAVGWVGVLVRPTGRTTLHVGSTIVGLVEQVREQETVGAVATGGPVARSAEVEAWIRAHPSVEVTDVGADRSLKGITVPPMYSGMGFDQRDLLEACGVAGEIARRFC